MTNYVLWLASWYPGKTSPFDGDFIERQAKAVSPFIKLVVIFVAKDSSLRKGDVNIQKEMIGNLIVYRGYYGESKSFVNEKLFSLIQYMRLHKKIFSLVRKELGIPVLVHVHVAFKAGLFALYLKKKYKIPYVITEHWTAYYADSPNSIYKSGRLTLKLIKLILRNSTLIIPVAKKLEHEISKIVKRPSIIVPNVVNADIFYFDPAFENRKPFRFIHPSSMIFQKNAEGIINAAISLHNKSFVFELLMIGANSESLTNFVSENGGSGFITFRNEVPYEEIAQAMRQSSALLMFSRFENLPCVILESLCCGMPVVSSDVGGINEVINATNGLLVESENEDQLENAMMRMIDQYHQYDRQKIAENATLLFNYNVVGQTIFDTYEKVLNNESQL